MNWAAFVPGVYEIVPDHKGGYYKVLRVTGDGKSKPYAIITVKPEKDAPKMVVTVKPGERHKITIGDYTVEMMGIPLDALLEPVMRAHAVFKKAIISAEDRRRRVAYLDDKAYKSLLDFVYQYRDKLKDKESVKRLLTEDEGARVRFTLVLSDIYSSIRVVDKKRGVTEEFIPSKSTIDRVYLTLINSDAFLEVMSMLGEAVNEAEEKMLKTERKNVADPMGEAYALSAAATLIPAYVMTRELEGGSIEEVAEKLDRLYRGEEEPKTKAEEAVANVMNLFKERKVGRGYFISTDPARAGVGIMNDVMEWESTILSGRRTAPVVFTHSTHKLAEDIAEAVKKLARASYTQKLIRLLHSTETFRTRVVVKDAFGNKRAVTAEVTLMDAMEYLVMQEITKDKDSIRRAARELAKSMADITITENGEVMTYKEYVEKMGKKWEDVEKRIARKIEEVLDAYATKMRESYVSGDIVALHKDVMSMLSEDDFAREVLDFIRTGVVESTAIIAVAKELAKEENIRELERMGEPKVRAKLAGFIDKAARRTDIVRTAQLHAGEKRRRAALAAKRKLEEEAPRARQSVE